MSVPEFDARRLPDGRIEAPVRAEAPDGTIGDGIAVLAPGDERFDEWDRWLRQQERGNLAPDA
jgi:hypothetical protein